MSRAMTLAQCPVRTTLDVLTGKWKPLILFFLKPGMQRYGALRAHLQEAPERVFIQQLRELEGDGIVERFIYPEVPARVEYRISAYGETLMVILQQMADWGSYIVFRRDVLRRQDRRPWFREWRRVREG